MKNSLIFKSPIGFIELRASHKGLTSLKIVENTQVQNEESNPLLKEAKELLERYFKGERINFDAVPLDWSGSSPFFQLVWEEVLKIPHGKTCTYNDIAKALNNQKAVRAVGAANGKNPIPIIVPCHRVIASNGKMQGYYYGIEMKKWLLSLESKNAATVQGSLFV